MPRRRLLTESQVKFGNEGQTVTGRYMFRDEVPYQDKHLNKYTLESGVGTMVIIGTQKLDEAMEKASIGDMLEITFLGVQRTHQGFDVKLFEVAVLEEEEDDE